MAAERPYDVDGRVGRSLERVIAEVPHTPRVLIADDQAGVRATWRELLEPAGYEVLEAADGQEALDKVELGPDVVVADVRMPCLDGVQLLAAIRGSAHVCPVILVTGVPDLETAIRAVREQALAYLLKPVDPRRLIALVDRAARTHRLARLSRAARWLTADTGPDGDLEARFEGAVPTLRLVAQPIVSWSQRSVFGWELLLRCDSAHFAHIGALLSGAEQLGRAHEVGRRVRRLASDLATRHPDERLFVNLHPEDLRDTDLFDREAPLSKVADHVVLEITERAGLDDLSDLEHRVDTLREIGFQVALDDLGAGYASLTSFGRLAPDLVKMDMSLVRSVETSPLKARLVEALVRLCDEAGVRLIAEGVETEDERDRLVDLGCDLLQGYWFGRPEPEIRSPSSRAFLTGAAREWRR